jgi:4-alpha-glucanotransferase
LKRASGILLHISSLPGPYGIGSFGSESFDFVDFLRGSGQKYWQILPLNPTLYGNSPYQSSSAFALNHNFIDIESLVSLGLADESDLSRIMTEESSSVSGSVDFDTVALNRNLILRKAYCRFKKRDFIIDPISSFTLDEFKRSNIYWLDGYVEYMALLELNDGLNWTKWKITCGNVKDTDKFHDIKVFHAFVQYLLYSQWEKVRMYAADSGVCIIGDFPFYVSHESADCYRNSDLFKLGDDMRPKFVSGCPPDSFSETGQLWGNPVYDFPRQRTTGYAFFMDRFRNASLLYDVVRIDHFRGFEAYWEIDAREATAQAGRWVKSPGREIFTRMSELKLDLGIIAEDLGFITDEVHSLRDEFNFPGMKILQFAFSSGPDNPYLPHNCDSHSVIYTGTHDNDTVDGWMRTEDPSSVSYACDYLYSSRCEDMSWAFIRGAWSSTSRLAIAQFQDLHNSPTSARMNKPSTMSPDNWSYRAMAGEMSDDTAKKLLDITKVYGRYLFD